MKDIVKENIKNPEKYLGERLMTEEVLKEALSDALIKIDKLWEDVHGNFPSHASENNVYQECNNREESCWNSGFFTGMLWLAYEATGNEKYKERALSHIPSFYTKISEKISVNHHDMGFLFVPSCVAAYKLEGDELAKKSAIMAADHLLTRYNEKGGFIQAWGNVGANNRFIIDCMNNIPLLYWTAEVTSDRSYYEKAYSHARVTIENIVREDASTYHTFFFDNDGKPERGATAQGASNESCWSRGQAWIISGLPTSYRYTKDGDMLELFTKVTNYYLNHLPADFVPYWDLCFSDGAKEPKDSSSAAIASAGILAMLDYIEDAEEKALYEGAVDRMMYSLYTNYSTKNMPKSNGLLLHAVYSKPGNFGVDECNIWGCYYYMEAICRMLKKSNAYW